MVSVRFSMVEFRMIQDACARYGMRSVSEFARSVIRTAVGQQQLSRTEADDLRVLRARVDILFEQLARAVKDVERS
jgi:hypothetical protein